MNIRFEVLADAKTVEPGNTITIRFRCKPNLRTCIRVMCRFILHMRCLSLFLLSPLLPCPPPLEGKEAFGQLSPQLSVICVTLLIQDSLFVMIGICLIHFFSYKSSLLTGYSKSPHSPHRVDLKVNTLQLRYPGIFVHTVRQFLLLEFSYRYRIWYCEMSYDSLSFLLVCIPIVLTCLSLQYLIH